MTEPRSPIDDAVRAAGAVVGEHAGVTAVTDYGDPEAEIAASRRLGLADLSPLARVGFRGPGAREWLAARGVELPDEPNRARVQPDGSIAIARSWTEALVLGALRGADSVCDRLEAGAADGHRVRAYSLPRFDGMFWFALTGASAVDCLAKLCGVDMRESAFPVGSVAQTSLARLNAVIVRVDLGDMPVFHLLGDSASAEYAWASLLDAMQEFDGRPVGLRALHALAREFE
ncbi:MAG: sarcosine oxidase [Chloroflexota bacterium]|nr:sarcosine oxidase [Chloroflexota bacterium]